MVTPENSSEYDVVIAGGGMVGVSLSIALSMANESLSILLVDNFSLKKSIDSFESSDPIYHPSFDARPTALSASSIDIFESLGVLDDLLTYAEKIKTVHVSDKGGIGSTILDAKEQQKDFFGYVIENHWLGSVLFSKLKKLKNITFLTESIVQKITSKSGYVGLSISSSKSENKNDQLLNLQSKLLFVADGTNSNLRESLGIEKHISNYMQEAIITNLQTELPHHGCAYEHFTSDGAIALLPLVDIPNNKNRSALVWTIPIDDKSFDYINCKEDDFINLLQVKFGSRLGKIKRVGVRKSYPLKQILAKEVVRQNIVIMGNAAHSLHPIAAQGFNLCLRDIALVSELIGDATMSNQSIGSLELLNRYAELQSKDQNRTLNFSEKLIDIFGSKKSSVRLGRNIGLLLLDSLFPLKKYFSDKASGISARRPLQ